eukprot:CAMPEP_0119320898 /NCGR_PEP_ID=MMETSP1333-20130426/53868_1 /TAXON_ID=418940 /ORGANISM="Scyphosphaera apsteinii, Strain RCC1455" /LENGTH=137 /DNA_ID=CAMNT_0007327733 /DNA_START=853 /DNA_END=1262 /DNA_ORIENTATION=+
MVTKVRIRAPPLAGRPTVCRVIGAVEVRAAHAPFCRAALLVAWRDIRIPVAWPAEPMTFMVDNCDVRSVARRAELVVPSCIHPKEGTRNVPNQLEESSNICLCDQVWHKVCWQHTPLVHCRIDHVAAHAEPIIDQRA